MKIFRGLTPHGGIFFGLASPSRPTILSSENPIVFPKRLVVGQNVPHNRIETATQDPVERGGRGAPFVHHSRARRHTLNFFNSTVRLAPFSLPVVAGQGASRSNLLSTTMAG